MNGLKDGYESYEFGHESAEFGFESAEFGWARNDRGYESTGDPHIVIHRDGGVLDTVC